MKGILGIFEEERKDFVWNSFSSQKVNKLGHFYIILHSLRFLELFILSFTKIYEGFVWFKFLKNKVLQREISFVNKIEYLALFFNDLRFLESLDSVFLQEIMKFMA